ncbi:MAG: DUF362 domain-containing protein [Bacteroidales bacterium]
MVKKLFSRREALKNMLLGAAGSFLLSAIPWKSFTAMKKDKSRVILIRDENLLDNSGRIDPEVLKNMMDRAIPVLVGDTDPATAWKKIVNSEDTLGIKSNEWSYLPTPAELEQYIKERAIEAGIRDNRISIDDRGVLQDSIFQSATALINVRPMRTHDWSGVGSLIKNYIMFIDKPQSYHGDNCADLAKIWKKKLVRDKTRLNILVMITPLFHGVGPHHFNKKYTWKYNGLIVSFDPVAADATGLRILQAKRNEYFGEEKPISPSPKHIELADTRHNLGNASSQDIELIKLGWEEGLLI